MDTITLPGAAGGATVNVSWDDFPEHIRAALMLHGLQQKVADAASGAKAKEWTETQAREACEAVIASLKAGTWSSRVAGPRARNEDDYIAQKVRAKILATVKAKNASVPEESILAAHVAKVIASPASAAWITALRAEYAAKKATIDLGDLI